jgi:hypothetical protein
MQCNDQRKVYVDEPDMERGEEEEEEEETKGCKLPELERRIAGALGLVVKTEEQKTSDRQVCRVSYSVASVCHSHLNYKLLHSTTAPQQHRNTQHATRSYRNCNRNPVMIGEEACLKSRCLESHDLTRYSCMRPTLKHRHRPFSIKRRNVNRLEWQFLTSNKSTVCNISGSC